MILRIEAKKKKEYKKDGYFWGKIVFSFSFW